MLKHILTTTPANGSISNGSRAMAASEGVAERPDAVRVESATKIDEKSREFAKADSRDGFGSRNETTPNATRIDRVDGLGPRTDARGDVRERNEHIYREASRVDPRSEYSTREAHGGDVTPMLNKSVDGRNDSISRNAHLNRVEHHRGDYHAREPPPIRDYRSDYRGDVTPRDPSSKQEQYAHHRYQNMSRRDPLSVNHSQLSVTAVQRLPQQQPLNISTLNSSKHSLGGTSSSASPGGRAMAPPKYPNGGLNISRMTTPGHGGRGVGALATLNPASLVPANVSRFMNRSKEVGIKEMLTSLGLLCLVSLLLALLSLIFLLKISPVTSTDVRELLRAEQLSVISAEEYVVVYEVTLALCALALSLNLCCLLVCAVQFLFAVKLVNSNGAGGRTNKYLQKSSVTRVCAVGGFFISIPVFLTGIILYTFIQFHSTPAIITSVFIGLGIIFCGCAMVHNVFVWQKEKTNAVKALHSQTQATEQSNMNGTQNISTPQSMTSLTGNGFLTNGHISSPGNTTHGTNMSFHNTTTGTTYSHHPITIIPHQAPYIIRPPTSTPPTPGELGVSNRPPRPPRPPASGSVSPPGVPPATLDLSHPHSVDPHELSTLV